MAVVTKQEAVERLTEAIKVSGPYDLAEYHNELFTEEAITGPIAKKDPAAVVGKILAHFEAGLEVEEIVSLWRIVFTSSRRVEYDEEDDCIHYVDKNEPVSQWDDQD